MFQRPRSHIEVIIQQITQDLQAIDDQMDVLEEEGAVLMQKRMNTLVPLPYGAKVRVEGDQT